jgi:hypothetical protein
MVSSPVQQKVMETVLQPGGITGARFPNHGTPRTGHPLL